MEETLLARWLREGKLPALELALEEGVSGSAECRSLSSAKQWTAHFTGVDPDKHGITGFLKNEESRIAGEESPDARELVNLNDIRVKTYPEILDERGVSVGLINPLPLWPPLTLERGFCVSGMLTPPSAEEFAHPPELQSELVESDYRIDVRYGNRPYGFVDDALFEEVSLETLEHDMFEVLDARIEFTKRTIREDDLDFTYCLLKSIDVIQHCFWKHMNDGHERYGDTILRAYERVDELVGWVREETDANVVVFSDHGFQTRTTRPPEGIHRLAVEVGDRISVPAVVNRVYERVFYREEGVNADNPGKTTGIHDDPAVWIATGPDVESGKRADVAFEDIAPTLFALLGEPIPEAYVGEAATSALSVEPEYADVALDVRRERTIDERDIVSERLHNLGYAEMVDSE